jgi:hypothetical protein
LREACVARREHIVVTKRGRRDPLNVPLNKINLGFAVDLSNYARKDLPRLHLRFAAIP